VGRKDEQVLTIVEGFKEKGTNFAGKGEIRGTRNLLKQKLTSVINQSCWLRLDSWKIGHIPPRIKPSAEEHGV